MQRKKIKFDGCVLQYIYTYIYIQYAVYVMKISIKCKKLVEFMDGNKEFVSIFQGAMCSIFT